LSEGPNKSGLFASGAMHVALLGLLVFGFSPAPKFDDASESIPVETITDSQLTEIMNGEKDAKPSKTPSEPAKAVATAEPTRPAPPLPPEPPPDLRKSEDTPPPPPVKPATLPPPPPRPVPPPPPPPPKPVADDAPTPPVKPKIVEKPPEKPREVEKPEKAEKPFKPDELAKLLAKEPAKEAPKPAAKEASKPAFDKNAIAKLIGQKTADASPTGATVQGLPNHHSTRMSESLENALNDWFKERYLDCWSPPPTTPSGENYVFDVRITFNSDGSLASQPVLANPPQDPAWRPHAESALRAVRKCDPLHVPPQYAPYFEQWRTKTIHFDPQSALG